MQRATVVELNTPIAMAAASISLKHSLPMADSIILATERHHEATIWTQDIDFKDIPGVNYFPKNFMR